MARNFKVFISHSWAHVQDLRNLKNLLENRGYFNVDFVEASPDVPINSQNAEYVKTVLRGKISDSDVVLGIAGIYASHSDWMAWELDFAIKKSIPIIGVAPRGQERLSTVVTSRSKQNVRWSTESIVSAIRLWT